MTTVESVAANHALAQQVADKYRARGYAVTVDPGAAELPFDLGSYRPDILAIRGDDKLLIEVKSSVRREPLDQLVDAANHVRKHPEWRLLLVTADDVLRELPNGDERDLPSWAQLRVELDRVAGYEGAGAHSAVALITWTLIEAILRRRCVDEKLPLYRLPTTALIKEMYSRGELLVSQYDALTKALVVRNEIAHGFVSPRVHDVDVTLRELAATLLEEWHAGSGG